MSFVPQTELMKTKTFYLAVIATFVWIFLGQSNAATIPAGTTLVVRTLQAISSIDPPGMRFAAELQNSLAVAVENFQQTARMDA